MTGRSSRTSDARQAAPVLRRDAGQQGECQPPNAASKNNAQVLLQAADNRFDGGLNNSFSTRNIGFQADNSGVNKYKSNAR